MNRTPEDLRKLYENYKKPKDTLSALVTQVLQDQDSLHRIGADDKFSGIRITSIRQKGDKKYHKISLHGAFARKTKLVHGSRVNALWSEEQRLLVVVPGTDYKVMRQSRSVKSDTVYIKFRDDCVKYADTKIEIPAKFLEVHDKSFAFIWPE